MNRDVVELEEFFQRLKSSRSALSAEMRSTAIRLRESGEVPNQHLSHAFDDYRDLFGRFQDDLGITTHTADPEAEPLWDTFHNRLSVCRDAKHATERLQVVDRLRVPLGCEPILEPVREASRESIDRLATSPWNESDLIQEVREGRHPLCRLVSLIERLDVLSDDEWTTEVAAVQQAYGVEISTAIARGKVFLSDSGRTN